MLQGGVFFRYLRQDLSSGGDLHLQLELAHDFLGEDTLEGVVAQLSPS